MKRREKIIAGIMMGCIGLYAVVEGSDRFRSRPRESTSIEEYQESLKRIDRARQQAKQWQRDIDVLKTSLGHSDEDTGQGSELLGLVQDLTTLYGLELRRAQPQVVSQSGVLSSSGLLVHVEGEWAAIEEFVRAYQSRDGLYGVDHLLLEAGDRNAQILKGRILLSVRRVSNVE